MPLRRGGGGVVACSGVLNGSLTARDGRIICWGGAQYEAQGLGRDTAGKGDLCTCMVLDDSTHVTKRESWQS